MKKILFPLFTAVTLLMVSCGDEAPTEEPTKDPIEKGDDDQSSSEVDLKGLREFDMSDYDLNVIIYIPEAYYTDENQQQKFKQPTIKHHEGEALWEITMAGEKNFHLVLEDWGDIPQSVADEKISHTDQNSIYEYIYNEEGSDYLLFSRVLKAENSTLDQKDLEGLPNHHFYAVKQIDGYYIIGKSYSMKDFYQVSARKMMNAVRGMKSSN